MDILSILMFLPLCGSLVILLLPKGAEGFIKFVAVFVTSLELLISAYLYLVFDKSNPNFQFIKNIPWIPSLNIEYFVGVDGISIPMVFLTTFLFLLALITSWNITNRVKEYFILFLILETGVMGVFLALDLFLFYIFWELVLIPMYFLIGIWGGENRRYAATKFILYTVAGSLVMLIGILSLYFVSEPHTFNIIELSTQGFTKSFQCFVFLLLFFGFAVKVPIFPFHTWLPDAHVEAPTAVSVILAGLLLKLGTYGFLRVSFPLLPEAAKAFAYTFAILGVINIIYGACAAMAQQDLKKMIAYSSISHMGYVLLAMASLTNTGLNGAMLQMFSHGVITGSLFMLVGVIYDRAHIRDIDAFGGLARQAPRYAGLMFFSCLASLGLPGLAGFVSEFLCLAGAFPVFKILTIASLSGIVITAVYLLWMLERVFLGELNPKYANLPDVDKRELLTLAPLVLVIFIVGVYPRIILDTIDPVITQLAARF
ncbi:MAG: complex I subunit 4 family protein [Candidatus Brocadiales bacterium]